MGIQNPLIKACVAEFTATALFVWIGCGSALATNKWGEVSSGGDLLTIATAFGFAITLLAYSIGHISGGHINPAVTLAMYLLGEVDAKTMGYYMMAQFEGAVVGALVLWGCARSLTLACSDYEDPSTVAVCASSVLEDGSYGPPFGLGVNGLGKRVSQGSGFFIELVGTYLLVFTICMTALHKKSAVGNAAPIAIGWAVMMAHIVMVPFTGCGINPARSFGPMLVNSFGGANKWKLGWWIFYIAPFIGAALAAWTYKYSFAEDEEEEDAKEKEALVAAEEAHPDTNKDAAAAGADEEEIEVSAA